MENVFFYSFNPNLNCFQAHSLVHIAIKTVKSNAWNPKECFETDFWYIAFRYEFHHFGGSWVASLLVT